jgi:hypothetical protein
MTNSLSKAVNYCILAENIRTGCNDLPYKFSEPHLSYVALNVSVFEKSVLITHALLFAVKVESS